MEDMGLFRLIYVSQVGRQVRYEDAEAIAKAASTRNAARGISGLLLYTPSHFIQVLEGDESVVREIYQHICQDPRHNSLRVLDESPIETREFGEWAMHARMLPPERDLGKRPIDLPLALTLLREG